MEKANKPKNNLFLKYLPRAASAVSFQNPTFSPGRDKRSSTKHGLGFSGPLIPLEARRRPKNGSTSNFDVAQEPTSPKVSCIGQIKLKHKQKKMIKKMKSQPSVSSSAQHHHKAKESKKQPIKFHKIFGKSKSDIFEGKSNSCGVKVSEEAPSLGMMRKFASGRETLGNFDWKAEIKGVDFDDNDNHDYHSDYEEKRRRRRENYGGAEEDDNEKETIIPHSAPILIGKGGVALEPNKRKEINLWMRRNMASPSALQLKSRVASH
ncbi:hypothetical protein Ancab_006991 [Ancistrocladus abbreviatus]